MSEQTKLARYGAWLEKQPPASLTTSSCRYCGKSVKHEAGDVLDECPYCDGYERAAGKAGSGLLHEPQIRGGTPK